MKRSNRSGYSTRPTSFVISFFSLGRNYVRGNRRAHRNLPHVMRACPCTHTRARSRTQRTLSFHHHSNHHHQPTQTAAIPSRRTLVILESIHPFVHSFIHLFYFIANNPSIIMPSFSSVVRRIRDIGVDGQAVILRSQWMWVARARVRAWTHPSITVLVDMTDERFGLERGTRGIRDHRNDFLAFSLG